MFQRKYRVHFLRESRFSSCCSGGRGVIIGIVRVPTFGPMLMFGLGGVFVEILKDVQFAIAPVNENEAWS